MFCDVIKFLNFKLIFLLVIFSSCHQINDYYNSDDYVIKKRQMESLKMFEKTHKVRKKCSRRYNKLPRIKRKGYYSN